MYAEIYMHAGWCEVPEDCYWRGPTCKWWL